MALFDFAKTVGRRLGFGKGKDEDAKAIKKEIEDLGLDAKGVEVKVDGDKVILTGGTASQEDKEKIILAAGNVEGVGVVEDNLTPAQPAPAARFHVVEKGDTLWAISKRVYGDGSKYPKIFEANKPLLSDPDKIYPGQTLRIPE
jgi:nucleoid-associated protein YgaU